MPIARFLPMSECESTIESTIRRNGAKAITILSLFAGISVVGSALAEPPLDTGVAEVGRLANGAQPVRKSVQIIDDELARLPTAVSEVGKDGAAMTLVQAGTFMMGSNQDGDDEEPVHQVYLDAFYIDKYEVTVGQFAKFLEATNSDAPPAWKEMNKPQHMKRPVGYIDWADADRYCRWADKRLPTEAEWEKAARGIDGRRYPWGNDPPTNQLANFGKMDWKKHAAFLPVGSLENGKSPYGVYEMAGNVWEWVADWYDSKYYSTSPSNNPKGPARGDKKVLRGASIIKDSSHMGATSRWSYPPTLQRFDLGFRCAKTP